jgi:hypothetical protein
MNTFAHPIDTQSGIRKQPNERPASKVVDMINDNEITSVLENVWHNQVELPLWRQ